MLPTHLVRDTFRYELNLAKEKASEEKLGFLACMLAHLQRRGKHGPLKFDEAVKVLRRFLKPAATKTE